MNISVLKIQNFMPYKGDQEIVFPRHETQNVMLIFGDNMRGKTSILNAIRWGFYGIALGRHLRQIPRVNLVNRDAASEGDWRVTIELLFEHESKEYALTRSIVKRQNTTHPRHDADFKEVVGLRIDGTAITGDAINYEISQIMPQEVSRFFLFDGELLQEYENLLVDQSDQGRLIKERIESVLGVPALIHARDELKILLKDARAAQRKDAQKSTELKQFASDQRDLELKLDDIENNLKVLQQQEANIQEEIDSIDDFLKNTEAVQNRKIELSRLEVEQNQAETDIDQLMDANRSLLRTIWKDVLASSVRPTIDSLLEKRKQLQSDLQSSMKLQNRIDDLTKTIEESKMCGTCGQSLPESVTEELRAKLDNLKSTSGQSDVDMSSLTSLSATIDSLERIRGEGEVKRIIDNINSITASKVRVMAAENKCEEIQEEIRGFDTDEIMRQREQRERWQKQLGAIGLRVEEAMGSKDKNVQKQEKISELITKHGGTDSSLSNRRVALLQELETVFSKGIDSLRLKVKGNVEDFATKAFMQMTTEKTYSGLQINDNYGLAILDPKGEVLSERSAGAEQVVALALIDGLNKTSGTRAPIVMDTPLGRLDPKHRQNILGYLPDMAEQVVLLVHEGEIHSKRDITSFASRIGARYEIKRVSATQSRIEKVV